MNFYRLNAVWWSNANTVDVFTKTKTSAIKWMPSPQSTYMQPLAPCWKPTSKQLAVCGRWVVVDSHLVWEYPTSFGCAWIIQVVEAYIWRRKVIWIQLTPRFMNVVLDFNGRSLNRGINIFIYYVWKIDVTHYTLHILFKQRSHQPLAITREPHRSPHGTLNHSINQKQQQCQKIHATPLPYAPSPPI
jgi:hypothetical protein